MRRNIIIAAIVVALLALVVQSLRSHSPGPVAGARAAGRPAPPSRASAVVSHSVVTGDGPEDPAGLMLDVIPVRKAGALFDVRFELTSREGLPVSDATFVIHWGDGSPEERTDQRMVSHAFAPAPASEAIARYTLEVTATCHDGRSLAASATVETANEVGVDLAQGRLRIDSSECALIYSERIDRWSCTAMVHNPHDEAVELRGLSATRAGTGDAPLDPGRSIVEQLRQRGAFITLDPWPAGTPTSLAAGATTTFRVELPRTFIEDGTQKIQLAVGGEGARTHRPVSFTIAGTPAQQMGFVARP